MATTTTNLGLRKPATTDTVNVTTDISNNMDTIDSRVVDKNTVDAKGDLLVGTAPDAISRLAVGTNDQVLTADSTQATGMRWAAVSGIGAWTTYVPVLTQSGTVTATVTRARYVQNGNAVTVAVRLTVTGTGTAGNRVTVSLPVTSLNSGPYCGVGVVFDTSLTQTHRGLATLFTTTTVAFEPTNSVVSDFLGVTGFTAALASGDIVDFTITYEAA